MIVDGKRIAEQIYTDVKSQIDEKRDHPCLAVFTCNPNSETKKFLELKKKRAAEAGVDVALIQIDADTKTEGAVDAIKASTAIAEGLLIQLPFPSHIEVDRLIASIPKELDVDAMHYNGEETDILPPVVGAIAEIAKEYKVDFSNKNVAVIGKGRLVGTPVTLWVKTQNADKVTVIDKDTENADELIKEADIIISGAGSPGLITPDKIKEGVVIFDAGTSEEGGVLRGDADPTCAEKASLFTPVPGGIGPITIAVLLRNLLELSKNKV